MSGFKHYFDKFLGKKDIDEKRLPLEEAALEQAEKEKEEKEKAENFSEDSLILEKTDINNQIVTEKRKKSLLWKKKVTEEAPVSDSNTVTINKNVLLTATVILIVVCVAVSFFVSSRLFFGGYFAEYSYKVSFNPDGTDNYTLSKLQSIITTIENEFYPGVDKNVIAEGAIEGIVNALGDDYTVYYKPGTMDKFQEVINGTYQGMGAVVKSCSQGIEVTAVYDDSPAAKAGIAEGDIITAINDEATLGMESSRLEELLGTGGSQLEMKVTDASGAEKNISLTIDTVQVQTVFTQPEGDGIYRVIITQFDNDTGNEFYTKVSEIIEKGCRAMVLDLRNNGGGYESEAVKVADMILPQGTIATSKDKDGNVIKEIQSKESELDMPVAVLVNGNTASASELVAGAIKDFGNGKIIGNQTFGKAIGQIQISFEQDGSGLVITTACYYTPSGDCIQGKGITPDFHVDLAEEYQNTAVSEIPESKDSQLQKALEILTSELD